MSYLKENFTTVEIDKLKDVLDHQARELFENTRTIYTFWVDYGRYLKILVIADRVLGQYPFETRGGNHEEM